MTNPEHLPFLLPILRGALAGPSDNDLDPHNRVILAPTSNAGVDALVMDPDPVSDADTVRVSIHKALEGAASPGAVSVKGVGDFEVQQDAADPLRPLANNIALVTGAAGAIGSGICQALLEKGCRVAATDVARDALDGLLAELKPGNEDRILGVTMDVTDPASVKDAFAAVIQVWGGVDIVIVNAGAAHVQTIVEMDVERFKKLEQVNVEGTLHTLGEAGRVLMRQNTGGDIIVISTKNVFMPGAQFGAYSATKAASHQLARIASQEMAPWNIRVNMVSPDAVFGGGERKSGLWQEVGPSRMRARGLDEEGLEEYYRNRNLLKARITPRHVANAVLFFATRQTPTTGATIPVDGGLPDSTPR